MQARILVIDDNEAIHDAFHRLLLRSQNSDPELDELEALLFDSEPVARDPWNVFDVDVASQGQQGLERAREALAESRPYSVAFVDMRMPPGWDGLRTIREIWKVDPDLEIVICTAYSDRDWPSALGELGRTDKLLVLKKPFDGIEVVQMAHALACKWQLRREVEKNVAKLEEIVDERTNELNSAYQKINQQLQEREAQTRTLEEYMNPPRDTLQLGLLSVAGHCQLAKTCGGDWWTYRQLADDRVMIVVGDVAGRGIPAAMIAATARSAVDTVTSTRPDLQPKDVLDAIDVAIQCVNHNELLVAVFAVLIDPRDKSLSFVNAGHTHPYVLRADSDDLDRPLKALVTRGDPLGGQEHHVCAGETPFRPGDVLVMYSDGILDRPAPDRQRFGDRRFRKALIEAWRRRDQRAPVLLHSEIRAQLDSFGRGMPVDDDETLVMCGYAATSTSWE